MLRSTPSTISLPSPKRRSLLSSAAALALLGHSCRAFGAPSEIVVLTSYPDEVIAKFEAAFERANPRYRLRVVWRMAHDALPYLRQPDQGGVDVYWSPSPRNFALLKKENAWRRLDIPDDGLPWRIGNTELVDGDRYYRATEVAGYGFALNPRTLEALQVPTPRTWTDLTNPRLAGKIALPIPSRVAFAQVLADVVLQGYGWDAGWALLSEIAGLSRLIERGGTLVSDEVASGRAAVGVSIDFFVASAVANGAQVTFAYPDRGGLNPAHVAISASSRNPEGSAKFVAFLLSDAGQKLLMHPDIRKLPVRPSAYAGSEAANYHNPFAAARAGAYEYDGAKGRDRLAIVAAIFDQMLAWQHDELAALWQRLHAAEAAGKNAAQARRLLGQPPITESEAAEPALRQQYRERVEGSETAAGRHGEQWRASCSARRQEASRLLAEIGA